MNQLVLDDLALAERAGGRRRLYVRGPIPWEWLAGCARLPGRALHVALALCFEAGMRKSSTVMLRPKHRNALGLDRHAARRALLAMEAAGLVKVSRAAGSAPVVTMLFDGARGHR